MTDRTGTTKVKDIPHEYTLQSKPGVTKEEFDRVVVDFVQLLLWQGMIINKVRVDPMKEPSSLVVAYNAYVEAEGSVMGNILRRTLKAATVNETTNKKDEME